LEEEKKKGQKKASNVKEETHTKKRVIIAL
jgi:hypothetical protein